MSYRSAFLSLLVAPLLLATFASTAEAQSSEEIARERFAAGQQLMDEGEYMDAYAEFAAGYGLTNRPLFLYNMGQAARLGRQREDAIRDYRRYLEAAPEGRAADEARSWLRLLGAEEEATETESEQEATQAPTPEETAAAAMETEQQPANPPPPSETEDSGGSRLGLWLGVAGGIVALVVVGVVLGVVLSDDSEPLPQGNFGMTVTALGASR